MTIVESPTLDETKTGSINSSKRRISVFRLFGQIFNEEFPTSGISLDIKSKRTCWLSAILLAIERIPNAGSNQDRFKKFIKAEDQPPNFLARYSMIDFILQVLDISY